MFLSAKGLMIIIAMYCLSIGLLAGQWALGDVIGLKMYDSFGTPLKGNVISLINVGQINHFQSNVTNTDPATLVVNTIATTATMLWNLFSIAIGANIFNLLFFLGVPPVLVIGMTLVYGIFFMIFVVSAIYRFTI